MAFGSGRLSFDSTHVEWTGQKLPVEPETLRSSTILRIPLVKLLNLRLRVPSADDPDSFRENMLLTEVEGAGIQIGIGEGGSVRHCKIAFPLMSPNPDFEGASRCLDVLSAAIQSHSISAVALSTVTPPEASKPSPSSTDYRLPMLSPTFSNSPASSLASLRAPLGTARPGERSQGTLDLFR